MQYERTRLGDATGVRTVSACAVDHRQRFFAAARLRKHVGKIVERDGGIGMVLDRCAQRAFGLSKIAQREYGDASAWNRIYEANRDLLKDPDKIFPGQKLKIPPKT